MSMQYYSDYGYGIKLSDIENVISRKRFVEFLHLDENELPNLDEDASALELVEELVGENGITCLDGFIDYVFNKYLLWVSTLEDENSEIYLLYIPPFPWCMSTAEKSLTKENLDDIFVDTLSQVIEDGYDTSNLRKLLDYHEVANYG